MPITANENGVLHTLGTVTTNDGGVLRNNSTVSVNDGGVIRTIFSKKKVEINGIIPSAMGDGYMVITKSGSFKLSAPAGTRLIIGGGGWGGDSGYDYDENDEEAYCVGYTGYPSTLKINGATHSSGSKRDIISTKAGKVGGGGRGGQGGQGAYSTSSKKWLGYGGDGGRGGLPNGYGGNGGDGKRGGHGGSNGSGTDTGGSQGSVSGNAGGVGDTPGIYCYGGKGGDGYGGNKAAPDMYNGCSGGDGGDGGFVAVHTLSADLVNANCTLTIGEGGKGGAATEEDYISPYPGEDGGNGVLIIEW